MRATVARLLRRSPPDPRGDLLRRLPRGSVGAEVGVWRGGFSARILEIVQPARLHLIDPWVFRDDYPSEALYAGGKAGSQADMDAIYRQVVERFDGDKRVVVHRARSTDVEPGHLDWVYIDGDHTYDAVLADLHHYRQTPIICGDDYGLTGWWDDGVTRAVDEFAAGDGRDLVLLDMHQWLLI